MTITSVYKKLKMFKVIILLICVFNMLACKPTETKTSQIEKKANFLCLSSQSHCEIDSELGKFSVLFSGLTEQGKLKTELPFQIQVQLLTLDKKVKLLSIDSYIEGATMFMGKIPIFFNEAPHPKVKKAETMLVSCTQEVMTWRLWLDIKVRADDKVSEQTVFIDFDSKRF